MDSILPVSWCHRLPVPDSSCQTTVSALPHFSMMAAISLLRAVAPCPVRSLRLIISLRIIGVESYHAEHATDAAELAVPYAFDPPYHAFLYAHSVLDP